MRHTAARRKTMILSIIAAEYLKLDTGARGLSEYFGGGAQVNWFEISF